MLDCHRTDLSPIWYVTDLVCHGFDLYPTLALVHSVAGARDHRAPVPAADTGGCTVRVLVTGIGDRPLTYSRPPLSVTMLFVSSVAVPCYWRYKFFGRPWTYLNDAIHITGCVHIARIYLYTQLVILVVIIYVYGHDRGSFSTNICRH